MSTPAKLWQWPKARANPSAKALHCWVAAVIGHGFGAGNVDFGSSDFQNTIIGEAVKAAVEQTSTEVIADKDKLVTRTITVEGLIAAVDGGQIILNVGGKAGVKVGDQLTVERVSKEIKDPSTGKVIRRMATQSALSK